MATIINPPVFSQSRVEIKNMFYEAESWILFEAYKDAYLRIIEPHIKSLVKELALEELEHKHVLEKAYFEETVLMHEEGLSEGPSMKLALFLKETPLGDDADDP